jgi:ABC-type antimicrobial peptide transport system permease subunit
LVRIDPPLVLLTFAVVSVIGLLAGVYPSWRAGRVRPLEAIRSETE